MGQAAVYIENDPMTMAEIQQCDFFAMVVMWYREKSSFIASPCWMDEWCMGYFCSLRDAGIINAKQWHWLCSAFQTPQEKRNEPA